MNGDVLSRKLDEAEQKAWEALARYKFLMFGYWSAVSTHFNSLGPRRPNPFRSLVVYARKDRLPPKRSQFPSSNAPMPSSVNKVEDSGL